MKLLEDHTVNLVGCFSRHVNGISADRTVRATSSIRVDQDPTRRLQTASNSSAVMYWAFNRSRDSAAIGFASTPGTKKMLS